MAISFVGGTANGAGNGADCTLTLPSMLQNDIALVFAESGYIGDLTMAMTTGGYSLIAELVSSDTRVANFAGWYKFMGASPDATAVVTGSTIGTNGLACAALVFRGVKLVGAGGPFSTAEVDTGGINGTNPDCPSITTGSGDASIAAFGGTLLTDTGASIAAPTGYATNFQNFIQTETTVGYVGAGYKLAPAATENPAAVDISLWTSSADSWNAMTLALAAASVAPAVGAFTVITGVQAGGH